MLLGWFGKLLLVGCLGSNCYGGVIGSEGIRFTALNAVWRVLIIKLEQL
jgi:hypothetical protein